MKPSLSPGWDERQPPSAHLVNNPVKSHSTQPQPELVFQAEHLSILNWNRSQSPAIKAAW